MSQILWLNHNNVCSLLPLCERLSLAFPNLLHLSLMCNPAAVAAPFDTEGFHDYAVYRHVH